MSSLYGKFRTKTFTDHFSDAASFLSAWKASGLYSNGLITDASITTLYYLLYGQYGNSYVASSDPNRFKYQMWSIIFSYGPSWEKRLGLQSKLRTLTEDEIIQGSKVIYNHANNPGTEPSTASLEELEFIDDQNTSQHKKAKVEAYQLLWNLIKFDVTKEFIDKFDVLFLKIVMPERPLLYANEDNEDEEEVEI